MEMQQRLVSMFNEVSGQGLSVDRDGFQELASQHWTKLQVAHFWHGFIKFMPNALPTHIAHGPFVNEFLEYQGETRLIQAQRTVQVMMRLAYRSFAKVSHHPFFKLRLDLRLFVGQKEASSIAPHFGEHARFTKFTRKHVQGVVSDDFAFACHLAQFGQRQRGMTTKGRQHDVFTGLLLLATGCSHGF
ncbi:hypothetical protein Dxin01_00759 [Deinococcus xinjiangensis]|uniref:Uncharacterized protein n=1 Tax=Deinococcus xinjiangensis TaxID=457454 RepID=A0ABP9V6W9_9DEIO